MEKNMRIRREVTPFLSVTVIAWVLMASLFDMWFIFSCLGSIGIAYFLYFFRDPERTSPQDNNAVVAGADGIVSSINLVQENKYLQTPCTRISIFLSLFDVHVNRAPISGKSAFLGYFPGKHLFTFQEKSSEVNQHNKILITGDKTRCLVCQIVGPVCRRVLYWPAHDKDVDITTGDRIGMMKFGSRLDMYLPADEVEVIVKPGDTVRAGETIVAHIRESI